MLILQMVVLKLCLLAIAGLKMMVVMVVVMILKDGGRTQCGMIAAALRYDAGG